MQAKPHGIFDYLNPEEIKPITRLRLSLSHLCEHKFKHSFQTCLHLISSYGVTVTLYMFSLLSHLTRHKRMTLLETIRSINITILQQNNTIITKDLFFRNFSLDDTSNTLISIKRFDASIIGQQLKQDEVIWHNLFNFC